MCGIFGMLIESGSDLDGAVVEKALLRLYDLSQSRGKEASGLAVLTHARIDVLKAPVNGSSFIRGAEARRIVRQATKVPNASGPVALMGHTRMVTNGSAAVHANNQPVLRDGFVAIHNGIIVNDADMWRNHPDLTRTCEVDTEALLAVVAEHERGEDDLASAVAKGFAEAEGANSIALMTDRHDAMVLATTNGSLFWTRSSRGEVMFASERYILEQIIGMNGLNGRFEMTSIAQVRPMRALMLRLDGKPHEVFNLALGEAGPAVSRRRKPWRTISDPHQTAETILFSPQHSDGRVRALERAFDIDMAAIGRLKRCTRCLLPETFPFIHFDGEGVCTRCRQHRPMRAHSEAELHERVAALRTAGDEPNCLVPLSGGRDSCYGLHYIIKDLGLKPVAYTYDWGMVTDLARRNISRMCGSLGVEHILVSANIARKREFIRMNVAAWLKRPHLGTIPLFMAGDKQFFYYASLLRKQMKLPVTLFSMNPLERTDFKVGFCGIDEGYDKTRHYDPSVMNKARISAFYAGEFLTNPAYLNSSLLDSFGAFLSYYVLKKDFLSIFDYIPWREDEIVGTLLDEYDWETATDTKSTWRIGDGTAAFYNYIYYRVAGFTENDTFRSNQIREGLVTREKALDGLETDNQPRPDSLLWYFDAIGLDAVSAVERVNQIPRLY